MNNFFKSPKRYASELLTRMRINKGIVINNDKDDIIESSLGDSDKKMKCQENIKYLSSKRTGGFFDKKRNCPNDIESLSNASDKKQKTKNQGKQTNQKDKPTGVNPFGSIAGSRSPNLSVPHKIICI